MCEARGYASLLLFTSVVKTGSSVKSERTDTASLVGQQNPGVPSVSTSTLLGF